MLNSQMHGLLQLIRSFMLKRPEKLPAGFSLASAMNDIAAQQITSIVLEGATLCGLQQKTTEMSTLATKSCALFVLSERQMNSISRILQAFDAEQIDYILLKGIVLKKLYPAPYLREMSDADILIKPEQYDKIKKVMTSCGFTPGAESDHELHWHSEHLHLELHKRLIPSNNQKFASYFEDIWSRALRKSDTSSEYCMSGEDELIFYVTHFAKHYRDGGIGAKHLIDLWLYLQAYPELDRAYIDNELEKLSLTDFYACVLETLQLWFADGKLTERTEALTSVVLGNGAFGNQKSQYLAAAARYSAEKGSTESGRKKRILYLFFPPYQTMCRLYPIVKKVPVLLPFVWIYRWIHALLYERKTIKVRYSEARNVTSEAIEQYQNDLALVGLRFDGKE